MSALRRLVARVVGLCPSYCGGDLAIWAMGPNEYRLRHCRGVRHCLNAADGCGSCACGKFRSVVGSGEGDR